MQLRALPVGLYGPRVFPGSRMTVRTILFLLLSFHCSQSLGAALGSLLTQDVAGVPWTAAAEDIEKKLPGGKWSTYGGLLPIYTVNEGSKFFGVGRTAEQTIVYGLATTGKLAGVSINFPSDIATYGDLLESLTEKYGSADTTIKRVNATMESIQTVWEGNGLRLILSHGFAGTIVRNDLIILRPDLLPESWRNFGLK
jgi:hypothetical protein